MTRAYAMLRLDGGPAIPVSEQGVIGRSVGAALRVLHPAVSEAHAMLVRRGTGMRLLSLRGRMTVDGEVDDDIELVGGLRVDLAPGCVLEVVDVVVPSRGWVARLDGGSARPLVAPAYALLTTPEPDLVPGVAAGGAATLLDTGDEWWLVRAGHVPLLLGGDGVVVVDGVELGVEQAELIAAVEAQRTTRTGLSAPLTLVARHTSVHVHRHRRPPAVIDALPGRILSEVATMGAPVGWEVVAAELWPAMDGFRRRMSWDRALRRLRADLAAHGIRDDLVRPDGRGNVELVLLPGDRVIDET